MKKNILFFIVAGALTLSACSKDFLERIPANKVPEEQFWKTENDVYLAVNSIYGKLPGESIAYDDGASDLVHAQYPWESPSTEITSGEFSTAINAGWDYVPIRVTNYFLENVDKAVMDEGLRARYIAEVRFVRAYLYIKMFRRFGDVPLITKVLDRDEANVPRTPRAEVLNFVLTELQAAADVLPAQYEGGLYKEKGRITKGAALALKARVHLFESNWEMASKAAQDVMTLGYQLFSTTEESDLDRADDYTKFVDFDNEADQKRFRAGLRSYEGLFHQKNEGNSEVILDHGYAEQTLAQSLNTLFMEGGVGGWSSLAPTQHIVDAYGSYKTGKAITPVTGAKRAENYAKADKADFVAEFKNRDPRFYASILFETAPWNALTSDGGYAFKWVNGSSNMSQTGYNFRKMVDPTASRAGIDNHANIILIRYAEVLLTFAEAQNELAGPSTAIYDALDQIRVRAGMPKVDRVEFASQPKLREFIRNERAVELVLEGLRYDDIRRWKTAPDVMKSINKINNTLAQQRVWDDRLYLMPVPQQEIDLSYGVLKQNTGYN